MENDNKKGRTSVPELLEMVSMAEKEAPSALPELGELTAKYEARETVATIGRLMEEVADYRAARAIMNSNLAGALTISGGRPYDMVRQLFQVGIVRALSFVANASITRAREEAVAEAEKRIASLIATIREQNELFLSQR